MAKSKTTAPPLTPTTLRANAARAWEDAAFVRNPTVRRDLRRSAEAFEAMAEAEEKRTLAR